MRFADSPYPRTCYSLNCDRESRRLTSCVHTVNTFLAPPSRDPNLMSGRTDKQTKRALRRALGPEVMVTLALERHRLDLQVAHLALLQVRVEKAEHHIATQATHIALLQAQLQAAGFGTNAPSAETAHRAHDAQHAILSTAFGRLETRLCQLERPWWRWLRREKF